MTETFDPLARESVCGQSNRALCVESVSGFVVTVSDAAEGHL